jgi:hypothetical protein
MPGKASTCLIAVESQLPFIDQTEAHCAGATVRRFEIQLDPLKDTQCAAGTNVALARRDLKMRRNARS